MASEEEHVIRQFLSLNYECLNYFDFSLADNKKGRPHGGRTIVWNNIHKVTSCITLGENILKVRLIIRNIKTLIIYCVWLKFDDNTYDSLHSFKNDLDVLESEINICKREGCDYLLIGLQCRPKS